MTSGISYLSYCLTVDFQCAAPDIDLAIMRYAEYCSSYEAEVGSVQASVSATTTGAGATGTGTGTGDLFTGSAIYQHLFVLELILFSQVLLQQIPARPPPQLRAPARHSLDLASSEISAQVIFRASQ